MFGDDEHAAPQKSFARRVGAPAAVLVFVSGGAWGIITLLHVKGPAPRPHIEQHIMAVNLPPPPPPPPPPKPEEKPKEEPKQEQKIVQPKAQPKAPTPPAALTATAGAGTDAFGLRAGEGGGGDCVSDCGGGDDGEQGSYYSTVVNSMVRDALRGDEKLRSARFRGQVAFTLDRAGHPENITFRDFQGDPETREMLLRALQRMVANEQIPANMTDGSPWVVRLNAHAPG